MEYGQLGAQQARNLNQVESQTQVDRVNSRLSSILSDLAKASSRIDMIGNKIAGVAPPSEAKAVGGPAQVPSCSCDWLGEIERQINTLNNAINRLD